jgi:hypothetical protein
MFNPNRLVIVPTNWYPDVLQLSFHTKSIIDSKLISDHILFYIDRILLYY